MNGKKRIIRPLVAVIAVILVVGLLLGSVGSIVAAEDSVPATITTNKTKYSVGETMVISGSWFTPDATVNIEVQLPGNNGIDSLPPVATDAAGSFETYYTPPMIPGRYKITATDGIDTAKTAVTEADAANYDLIAFGVKTNSAGTTVTDIGWGRGNSDKGWREGDWVPVKLVINTVQSSYPDLVGLPDIYIGFDYTAGPDDARFVDLVRDIQVSTSDLDDAHGWPKPDGTPYDTGTGSAPWPDLDDVHIAQTSPGQNIWIGFTDLQSSTMVNWPEGPTDSSYSARPGAVDDATHQFIIPASAIISALSGSEKTETICIYFQAHLSRTFAWLNSLQKEYNNAPYNAWGGDLYTDTIYATDSRYGSSYAPGSSGHMYVLMTGQGKITCQLPIPPKPLGLIEGLKWHDYDANGVMNGEEPEISGWTMRILGVDPEGLTFITEAITGDTDNDGVVDDPDSGAYSFPNLTEGTWYVGEFPDQSDPPTTDWNQTYPSMVVSVPPVANSALTSGFPAAIIPAELAAWGWIVDLTETNISQSGLDFGNFMGTPAICIEKTVDCNNDGVFLDEDMGYAGDTGHWKIVVTNCGDTVLTDVMTTDTNGQSFGPETLDVDEFVTYEYDTVVDVDTTNTANVVATGPIGDTVTATDWATNYVISPAICIEKTVDCNDDGVFLDEDTGYAGDTGHWKVIVTNCGDSDLTNVIVTDSNGHDFGPAFDLAYGAAPVEFNYDTTVNDDTTNTATVVATDAYGATVTDYDEATNLVISPAICIEKTVDCNDDGVFLDEDTGYAGDTGHWKVIVTNCGDSDLTNVIVTDSNGHDFGPAFDLAYGAAPVEFNYDTTVNDDTTNTATVVATDAYGATVTDYDEATNLVISPAICIEKTVDCNDDGVFLDEDTGYAGDTGHWKVIVTNCGDSDLTNVIVTDSNGHDFGPAFDLAYGAAPVEFNYDTTVNDDTTNTATVVATDAYGATVTDYDEATNLVISPAICIEKTVDCNDDGVFLDEDTGYAGDTGHWKVIVTNCGDSDLTNVIVTDSNGHDFGPAFDLAYGAAPVEFNYDTTVNDDTTNTATVVATDAYGATVTDYDEATNLVISPAICIEKTVDCNDDGVFLDEDTGYAGDTGHWKVIVTNCGDSDLTNVIVTDSNGHDFGPAFDLAYGAAPVEFNYDTTVNDDTTNTATVVATDAYGATVTDYDEATNLVISPAICIEKTVDCNDDGVFLDEDTGYAGDTGHWKVIVTNCGDSDLTNVIVTDSNGHDFGPAFDLAYGAAPVEFNYDTTVNDDTTNTATVVATDAYGATVTDYDEATNLVISPAICIEKTVDCNDDGVFLDEDTGYAGDTGHWKVIVTNCGDSDLTNVIVTDSNGHDFGPAFDLAYGAAPVEFNYDTTVNDDTTNTATVVATDAYGATVTDYDEATNLVISPAICIEKTVDCNDDGVFLDEDTGYAGDTGHWKVIVTNCGDSDLTNVIVTDSNGHDFGPAFDLAYGAAPVEFNYDTTVNDDTTNTATVVATDAYGATVTDYDEATNLVISPAICIEKTVDCNDDGVFLDEDTGYAGDTGHWKVIVTNCGDSDLTNVIVTDSNGHDFGPAFDLAYGAAPVEFNYDTTVNDDTTNTATVVATDAYGATVTDYDEATNLVISPAICIEKTVDCNDDGVFLDEDTGYAGDTGHWKVIVTNCGDSDLTNVIVTDSNGHDFGPAFDLAYGAAPVEFNYDTTVNDDTTNTATVVATDAYGATVTDYDEATNLVISPAICIEKTVDCNDDGVFLDEDTGYAGDTGHWKVIVTNCGDSDLTNVIVTDSNGHDFGPAFDLAYGAAPVEFNYDTTVNDDTTNTATVVATDAYGATVTDYDEATNDVIHPHTTLTVFTYVYDTVTGNVEITITDCNDGDVPLTNAVVHLRANDVEYMFSPMDHTSPYFTGGDDNLNPGDLPGVLDPGECWTWYVVVTISENTLFEAWGYGEDPLGNPVTYDPDTGEGLETEYQSFEIEVGLATRTWGFWKTHLWLVEWMLDPANGVMDLSTTPIDLGTWYGKDMEIETVCQYMGLMWAKQSSNSDGGPREKIDAARIHTAHQALAAIMNYYMPGSAPLPAGITLASIAETLTNGTVKQIRDLGSILAGYNESGDDQALDPSLPPTGKTNNADPQGGRIVGAPCEGFWDTPEASKGKNKNK